MSNSESAHERGTEVDTRQTAGDEDTEVRRSRDDVETRAGQGAPSTDGSAPADGVGDRAASESGRTDLEAGRQDSAAADRGGFTERTGADTASRSNSLVSDPETLRRRWESVQVGFVDDPRQAVRDADGLVSSVIEDLADGFRQQRERLESRWSEGDGASTDDLRESFQRYRAFFERLLQV